jgi:hypothetical protein
MMKLFKTREEQKIDKINRAIFKARNKIYKLTGLREEIQKKVQGGLTDARPF